MDRIFTFFKDKKKEPPAKVMFSTTQLKYHKVYWLSIRKMSLTGRASIQAEVKKGNTIEVRSENVKEFAIASCEVPGINKTKPLKIVWNGKIAREDMYSGNAIVLAEDKDTVNVPLAKTHETEGPVNDFFTSRFIVVQGTSGGDYYDKINALSVQAFVKNWTDNYFGPCFSTTDTTINSADLRDNHLILIGTPVTNSLMKQVMDKLPLRISSQSLVLNGQLYRGDNLGYTMIYPNPLNPQKYILLIGSNNPERVSCPADLSYKGWFDYEIYNLATNTSIDRGRFNRWWR